jgi:hypothetical protein
VCPCGAKLKFPGATPGKVGRCPRCNRRHTIGKAPPSPTARARSSPKEKALVDSGVCSACYTPIPQEEDRQTCPACGLVFHVDCWQENMGCSAYGCPQVNALKPKGPELSIPAAIDTPPARSMGEPNLSFSVMAEDRGGIPWHVLFLVLSVVAGLLSLVAFGVPSLLVMAVTLFYTIAASQKRQIVWLILAMAGAFAGFLLGVIVSVFVWFHLVD